MEEVHAVYTYLRTYGFGIAILQTQQEKWSLLVVPLSQEKCAACLPSLELSCPRVFLGSSHSAFPLFNLLATF